MEEVLLVTDNIMKWQNSIYLLLSIFLFSFLSINLTSAFSSNSIGIFNNVSERYISGDDASAWLGGTGGTGTGQLITQTFTIGTSSSNANYLIDKVGLKLGKTGTITGWNITLSIRNVDGSGVPTGNDLINVTYPSVSYATAWYNFSFNNYIMLNSSTKYALIVKTDGYAGNPVTQSIDWYYDNTAATYGAGDLIASITQGSTWQTAYPTKTTMFELYGLQSGSFPTANTYENLTFSNYNQIRYISVPQNTYLTNAYMNLSNIINWNIDKNKTNNVCSLYNETIDPTNACVNAVDNDWNTKTDAGSSPANWNAVMNITHNMSVTSANYKDIYLNFKSTLINTDCNSPGNNADELRIFYLNSTGWQTLLNCTYNRSGIDLSWTSYSVSIKNYTLKLPNDAIVNNNLTIRYNYEWSDSVVSFYEGELRAVYETNNTNITINNNSIWQYPSYFNLTNNKTTNFASYINSYLSSCSYLNGYCEVPINFYSSTNGTLGYSDLSFSNTGITENNQSYSPISFETQSNTFTLNLTYDDNTYTSSSANLVYNGTSYSSTRSGSDSSYLFSTTIDLPLVNYATQNRSFYWNISLTNTTGTYSFSSNTYYQVVNRTYLYICNLTYNVPYVNFTFQEETSLYSMNASIDESTWSYYLGSGTTYRTYSFINVSNNPSYAFCYNPSYKTVNTVLQYLKYSASGYPQRQYFYNSTYTNTTTSTILGLLSSANGIYTSIQTLRGVGSPLNGVQVVAERLYGGTYLTVGTGITDEAGIVTFWVNPNYPLRLTATKTGYPTQQVTINPSQTQYSLYMGQTNGNTTYELSTNGLRWTIFPANGLINTTTFGMNMTSYYEDIVACKLDLVRADDSTTLTSTSGVGGSDCNISLTYTIPTGVRVFGQFYVWTTASGGYFLIDSDALWYNLTTSTPSPWTNIQSLFHDLNNIPEFGTDELRQQFTKVIIFYFVLCLLIGLLCFFTEYDRLYPGFFVIIAWIVIFIASKGGFLTLDFGSALTNTTISNTMKQYMVAMISGLFTFGYILNRFARDA